MLSAKLTRVGGGGVTWTQLPVRLHDPHLPRRSAGRGRAVPHQDVRLLVLFLVVVTTEALSPRPCTDAPHHHSVPQVAFSEAVFQNFEPTWEKVRVVRVRVRVVRAQR